MRDSAVCTHGSALNSLLRQPQELNAAARFDQFLPFLCSLGNFRTREKGGPVLFARLPVFELELLVQVFDALR